MKSGAPSTYCCIYWLHERNVRSSNEIKKQGCTLIYSKPVYFQFPQSIAYITENRNEMLLEVGKWMAWLSLVPSISTIFCDCPSQYLNSTEHILIVEVWCSFYILLHILIVWKECMYNQMNLKKQRHTSIYSKPVNLCAEFWLSTLYLALGPGFVGHTGLNVVIRYTSSLVIAMAITLEPPLGTAVGWILHVSPPPGYINDNPSHL